MNILQTIIDHPYATAVVFLAVYEVVLRKIPAAQNITWLQHVATAVTAFVQFVDKYLPNKTEDPAEVFVFDGQAVSRVDISAESVS